MLLKAIAEKIPTHAVIFDVSTDRGIRSGNQTLTEIMYGLFLQSLGYSKDLDLSELEIALEGEGTSGAVREHLPNQIQQRLERGQRTLGVLPRPRKRGDAPDRAENLSSRRFLGEGHQAAGRHIRPASSPSGPMS